MSTNPPAIPPKNSPTVFDEVPDCKETSMLKPLGTDLIEAKKEFNENFVEHQQDQICKGPDGTIAFDYINKYINTPATVAPDSVPKTKEVVIDLLSSENEPLSKTDLIERIVLLKPQLDIIRHEMEKANIDTERVKGQIKDFEEFKKTTPAMGMFLSFLSSTFAFGMLTEMVGDTAGFFAGKVSSLGRLVQIMSRDASIKDFLKNKDLCGASLPEGTQTLGNALVVPGLQIAGIAALGYASYSFLSDFSEKEYISSNQTVFSNNASGVAGYQNLGKNEFERLQAMTPKALQLEYDKLMESMLSLQEKAKDTRGELIEYEKTYVVMTADAVDEKIKTILDDIKDPKLRKLAVNVHHSSSFEEKINTVLNAKFLDMPVGHLASLGLGFGVGTKIIGKWYHVKVSPESVRASLNSLSKKGQTEAAQIVNQMIREGTLKNCDTDKGIQTELDKAIREMDESFFESKQPHSTDTENKIQNTKPSDITAYDPISITGEWFTSSRIDQMWLEVTQTTHEQGSEILYEWMSEVREHLIDKISTWGHALKTSFGLGGVIDSEQDLPQIENLLKQIDKSIKNYSETGNTELLPKIFDNMIDVVKTVESTSKWEPAKDLWRGKYNLVGGAIITGGIGYLAMPLLVSGSAGVSSGVSTGVILGEGVTSTGVPLTVYSGGTYISGSVIATETATTTAVAGSSALAQAAGVAILVSPPRSEVFTDLSE